MTFQKEQQEKFHAFAADVMAAETTPHNATYQSVISTVYTLIEDKRLVSLHATLKASYSEYFNDPHDEEGVAADRDN